MIKKQTKYKLGSNFGKWTLINLLGEGGDGEVWKASSSNSFCAIKILKENDPEKLLRLKQEIDLINNCKSINGIVKVIDFDSSENPKWFTMPIAKNSFEFVRKKSISEIIILISSVAESLIELHQKNITHRDIKPSNLLLLSNNLILSDFGFSHHPHGDVEMTIEFNRRGIGSISTTAPEMRRYSKDNKVYNYKPADVYSLAKTLWIYLTGNKLGFDGEYRVNSNFSLKNYLSKELHELLPPIEKLLIKSTKEDPLQRPKIKKFYKKLINIIQNINNFENNNNMHWLAVINEIFPISIPAYVKWSKADDIFQILSNIIEVQHYSFYPNSEVNTFIKIENENGKIKLITEMKSFLIIKNPTLTFKCSKKESNLKFFTLECQYKDAKKYKNGSFLFFNKFFSPSKL